MVGKRLLVTGPVGAGKSTLLEGLFRKLKYSGSRTDGTLSLRWFEDGVMMGYNISRPATGEKMPIALLKERRNAVEEDLSAHGHLWDPDTHFHSRSLRFLFFPRSIETANGWYGEIMSNIQELDAVIIDEIGYLELAGGGVEGAVSFLESADEYQGDVIVGVRGSLEGRFIERFSGDWRRISLLDAPESGILEKAWEYVSCSSYF